MRQMILPGLCLALLTTHAQAAAQEEPKVVGGMSILGNNDAPKSLTIVPWRTSELSAETRFSSGLMDESLIPVDRRVLQRELDFYTVNNP